MKTSRPKSIKYKGVKYVLAGQEQPEGSSLDWTHAEEKSTASAGHGSYEVTEIVSPAGRSTGRHQCIYKSEGNEPQNIAEGPKDLVLQAAEGHSTTVGKVEKPITVTDNHG